MIVFGTHVFLELAGKTTGIFITAGGHINNYHKRFPYTTFTISILEPSLCAYSLLSSIFSYHSLSSST